MDRLQRALMMAIALTWLAAAASAYAQDPAATSSPPRLSGVVYADYFYLAQSATGADTLHGFRFRRIYVSYDANLDSLLAARLTLEADETEQTSGGKTTVFVKHAYVERARFFGLGTLRAGLSPTPLFWTSERVWGYRSVEKTLLDRAGIGPATDLGVALQSPARETRPLGWHLMFANGAGQRRENDRAKRVTIAVPLHVQNVILEGVTDVEGGPGDRDRYLLKLFAGWQGTHVAAGLETFRRVIKNSGVGGADVAPTGISAFGRARVRGPWSAFVRYDLFDPDAEVETTGYREHFFLGGVDLAVGTKVHLIPNVAVRAYGAKNDALPSLDNDVELRLTLFLTYP